MANIWPVSLFSEKKFDSGETFQFSQSFAYPDRFGSKIQKWQSAWKVENRKNEEKN